MQIKDKWVLVTGASRRVGAALALSLAERGAHIVLHYRRSRTAAEHIAETVRAQGVECRLWQEDFADPLINEERIRQVFSELPLISALLNNASSYYPTTIHEVTGAHWQEYFGVHVLVPFLLSREFSNQSNLTEGVIINITDSFLARPRRDYLPYTVTKVGLEQLTKCLAVELAPKVRVNSIAPGFILPPEREAVVGDYSVEKVLLERRGSPQEIAEAMHYLLEANYITGQTITVDGGRGLAAV